MLEEAAVSICWVAIKTDMIEMPVSLPSPAAVSIFHFKSSGSPLGYGWRGSICDSDLGPHASSLQDTLQQINRLVDNKKTVYLSQFLTLWLSSSHSHAFSLSWSRLALFFTPSPLLFPPTSIHSLNVPLHEYNMTSKLTLFTFL